MAGKPLSAATPTQTGRHPVRRYALLFGAVSGLFGALQVGVSVSAALESQAAIQSVYYGVQNGGANPTIIIQWLGPLLTATYTTCLLGFAISMWLCWAAGRAAAGAAGRRSAGTLAGLLTSAIGSALWVAASIAAALVVHTDGTITGILNTTPDRSTAQLGGMVIGLVIQEVMAAAIALGFGALAGRIGAGAAKLPPERVRGVAPWPSPPPFVVYPPPMPPGMPPAGAPPQAAAYLGSPVYPPPPELYRQRANANGGAWPGAYPPAGGYPAYPAYPAYPGYPPPPYPGYPAPGAAYPAYPPAPWSPPPPAGPPGDAAGAQGPANTSGTPHAPDAPTDGGQDAGPAQR